MKPWEKYQSQSSAQADGPWNKYKVTDQARAEFRKEQQMDRPIEAGLTSAAEAGTFGYLPQLEALATLGSKKLYQATGLFPESVGAELARQEEKGNIRPEGQFTALRDIGAAENRELAKYNPKASIAGTVAGGLLQAPLMAAAAPLKGASALKQAAATGALTGAIYNPGDVEGELSGLQLGERATGAAMGGLLGGVGQKIGETVSKIPTKLAEKAKTFGERGAIKAAGAYGIKQMEGLMNKKAVSKVADVMKKEGLLQPGQSYDDVLGATKAKLADYGRQIDEIYSSMGAQPFDQAGVVNSMLEKVVKVRPEVGAGNYDTQVQTVIDEITNSQAFQTGNVKGMNNLIGDVSKLIDFSKKSQELPAIEQAYKEIRNVLREQTEKLAEQTGNKQLKDLNRTYSALKDVEALAGKRVARESANQFLGLSDKILGSGGMAAGAMTGETPEERAKNMLIYGGLLGGGSKLMRSYGSPIASKMALGAGGLLEKVPQIPEAITTGGPSRQLLVNEMMRQRKQ